MDIYGHISLRICMFIHIYIYKHSYMINFLSGNSKQVRR